MKTLFCRVVGCSLGALLTAAAARAEPEIWLAIRPSRRRISTTTSFSPIGTWKISPRAFGDRKPRDDAPGVGLDSPSPVALADATLAFWGSADRPLSNALFISRRIREIRSELGGLGIPSLQYGHRPDR